MKNNRPITRILCFHDILPESVNFFESQMLFLKQYTNIISLDDFFDRKFSLNRINTVITFDDGYKSWITDVIPILKRLKIPATFFLTSGFIGLSKKSESEFIRSKLFTRMGLRPTTGCLKSKDVKIISDSGFIIGGHTLNHANLSKINELDKIILEINSDKTTLEKIINKKIKYFSYPGGDFLNRRIALTHVLKELDFIGAVTTLPGFNTRDTNPYLLNRDIVFKSMPIIILKAMVYGNYDPINFLKRRLKYRFS